MQEVFCTPKVMHFEGVHVYSRVSHHVSNHMREQGNKPQDASQCWYKRCVAKEGALLRICLGVDVHNATSSAKLAQLAQTC